MPTTPLSNVDLPGIKKLRSGKVREVFDLGDTLLFVVTDRLSAFDVVLPDPIPSKGAVLNQLSAFWFNRFDKIDDHFVTADFEQFPAELQPFREQLAGRSMIVKKTKPLAVECVVRGYLAGSGWKDYQKTGAVCGIMLPPGLVEAARLDEPIFTPSTKAAVGDHDLNITFAAMIEKVGKVRAEKMRDATIAIYERARALAETKGIIIADTKFEFGMDGDDILLIDEVLTPDSSRFWPMDGYRPGKTPESFDKQFVRDYLLKLNWDMKAPAPELPPDIVKKTQDKYFEALRRLTA